MIEKIPPYPSMMVSDYMQADAPYMAEGDSSLAQQVQAVAFRCSGNYLSKAFVFYPLTVISKGTPLAKVSATATWTDFYLGRESAADSYVVQWPFRLTEGYSGVGAMVTLATGARCKVGFRIQTKSLAGHSVTATNGDPATISVSNASNEIPIMATTATGGSGLLVGSGICRVQSPDLGASGTRRFVINPQVQIMDAVHPIIGLSNSAEIFIKSICLFEYPPDAVGS